MTIELKEMRTNKIHDKIFVVSENLPRKLFGIGSKFQIHFQLFSRLSSKFYFLLSFLIISQIVVSQNLNQSRIIENGVPFTGKAKFKFLISNDTISVWSNDGSSRLLEEPENAVEIQVVEGQYLANIGELPMQPMFDEVMQMFRNLRLSTWVDIGNGFNKLPSEYYSNADFMLLSTQYADIIQHQIPQLVPTEKINKSKKENPKGEAACDIEDRYKQWILQHADKNGNIPFDGLIKAKEHVDRMPQAKDAGIWNWEWLGPGNIGGRIISMAIKPDNPDVIFIGSASGGLWKSTNGGVSWNVVNDFLPSLAISSIVYDQTNYNFIYLSTGEGNASDGIPGAGIFKSTDGGSTWSQLPSTNNNNFKSVFRLAHHPDSTGVLYATTYSPRGLWKTIDGGNGWTKIFTPKFAAEDIKISPHNHAHLMVGARGGAYRSIDYGYTWDTITNDDTLNGKLPRESGRCEIAFCPSNENRIYLSMQRNFGELYRSDDNGLNWTLANSTSFFLLDGNNQGNYDQALWVDQTNEDNMVVGGISIWRSADGGATLTKISDWSNYHNNSAANSAHSDQHVIVSHPDFNGTTNCTVYFGNDGGIQKATDVLTVSENSGWTNLAGNTLGISQFYGGAASPDGQYIIGGTQDNDNLRYKATGAWSGSGNWFQQSTGDGGFCAVDYSNSLIHYSEYIRLKIEKSVDGGDAWIGSYTGLQDALDESALFIAPFVLDPNNPERLIAGGTSIWRTTDGAENWSPINSPRGGEPQCSAIDIAPGNSDLIWIGFSNGDFLKTINGTDVIVDWNDIDNIPNSLPNRYVTDICINPNNNQEVYITFGGYNADNVWFTPDGGTTWENRSGSAPNNLPSVQVNTIRVHQRNSNWVYIGTDIGVFASEDKGQNWAVDSRYSEGNEIPANVVVSELFWQGTDYLIAATHGRGMYRALPLYTIYVDKNASPDGNGTQLAPYQTVLQAANAAGHGAVISIAANTYDENNILFTRKVRVITTNGATIIK